MLLLVGTRKGRFLIRGDDGRRSFEVEGPLLPGWEVKHAIADPRDGSLHACANSWVYGGTVQRSTDLGKTWERSEGLGLPEESGLKLASTWHLEPGHASQPGTLWLGGDPGVLFRSDDSGASWELIVAEEPAWAAVLREGMSFDDEAVYVGAQRGHVYALRDSEVVEAAKHLPPILSIEATAVR